MQMNAVHRSTTKLCLHDVTERQGLPHCKRCFADKIEVTARGEDQQLEKNTVEQLQTSNPNPPPEAHVKNMHASWLAYNRRVDVVLLPTNAEFPTLLSQQRTRCTDPVAKTKTRSRRS